MKARRALRRLAGEAARLWSEESGVALLLTLAVFLMLYLLCCGVWVTGETVRRRVELQDACDAAAYSAAVVQADALSRMAVVNRAMAWTYVQLCREQMDYIVYSWLDLACKRFDWDRKNKVKTGHIWDLRHYNFQDIDPIIEVVSAVATDGILRFGLSCKNKHHGEEGYGWYIGVGDTPEERKQRHLSLNGKNEFEDSVAWEDLDGLLEPMRESQWKEHMAEQIEGHKKAILALNLTLESLNDAMRESIHRTVQYVLFQNLPRGPGGKLDEEDMADFYWGTVGGVSGVPEVYGSKLGSQGTEEGSYFAGVVNSEEDEIQFLTMADGVPGRQAGAPGWMGGRPVVLSDYFGLGDGDSGNPTDKGLSRYKAGGLDQWYVRGSEYTAEPDGELVVKKEWDFLRNPPGGIQRVYKHSNREEGAQWRLRLHYRPNHVFRGSISAIGDMDFGEYRYFFDPEALLNEVLPGAYAGTIIKVVSEVGTAGVGAVLLETVTQIAKQVIGEVIEQTVSSIIEGLASDLAEIPPSNDHTQARYPEQCKNVNETTGLVAQYEWASAYWLCPWYKFLLQSRKADWHYRLPVAEFIGCSEHGYGQWLSWLPKEIGVLLGGGSTRDGYRSCFINLDGTDDKDRNTHLRGYARIYGDDKDIYDRTGYVGETACPWLLDKSFFEGDGTILVGLARRQRNLFERLVDRAMRTELYRKPSLYEPFSPQPGGDRFLVALSAARAAWAPRPDHPRTGMESMNDETEPGNNYDPRFDGVTDRKFKVDGVDGTRFGCVCGKPDTQGRLLRMWNLSQTDWDATLLPLRHAFDEHSAYDSYGKPEDGVFWEFDSAGTNAVKRLMGRLQGMTWANVAQETEVLRSGNILNIPASPEGKGEGTDTDGGGGLGRVYELFLHRRLL